MRYVELNLPKHCLAVGRLYHDENEQNLSEDMVDVVVGDFLLSAGYENGSYRIVVSPKGLAPNLYEETTDSVNKAKAIIEREVKTLVILDKVKLGMTVDEMVTAFGKPDTFNIGTRKYPKPTIFKYGEIELHFVYNGGLCMVYTEINGEPRILLK